MDMVKSFIKAGTRSQYTQNLKFCPIGVYQFRNIAHSSSLLKFILNTSKLPSLNEKDLDEKFVKGSGPGGQCVNKSSNACFIRHIPTGIVIKAHDSRSLEQNRRIARELLVRKLDELYNGDNSLSAQLDRQSKEKSLRKQQKMKKKQLMKKEWKETEGID